MDEKEIFWNAGAVEEITAKVTKANKPYILYKIGGEFISDFTGSDRNLVVGDRVKYSFSTSGSDGQFKNLLLVEKLPSGVAGVSSRMNTEIAGEGYTSPAFFGMVANQAVEWSMRLEPVTEDEMVKRIIGKFDLLWNLWVEKKKEKKVN